MLEPRSSHRNAVAVICLGSLNLIFYMHGLAIVDVGAFTKRVCDCSGAHGSVCRPADRMTDLKNYAERFPALAKAEDTGLGADFRRNHVQKF